MDELAKRLSIISFGIIGVICLIGVFQNRPWLKMFTIGVSLNVVAIPEGLPIVTTVTLALGVLRMAKRKAIVKKLHSIEALGSVSVFCSEKTCTLTRNEQTVTEFYTVDELVCVNPSAPAPPTHFSPALRKTLEVGAFCNDASTARNEDATMWDSQQMLPYLTFSLYSASPILGRLLNASLNAPSAQRRRVWPSPERIPPQTPGPPSRILMDLDGNYTTLRAVSMYSSRDASTIPRRGGLNTPT